MKKVISAIAASVVAVTLCAGAYAQDRRDDHRNDRPGPPAYNNNGRPGPGYDNNRYVRHNNWRKGYRMDRNDWNRGDRVDYRQYHLAPPRRGYEWRRVDGNFVMAAVATGVIASLVAASAAH
jgi:Ni/Co efflux regulator RcnB